LFGQFFQLLRFDAPDAQLPVVADGPGRQQPVHRLRPRGLVLAFERLAHIDNLVCLGVQQDRVTQIRPLAPIPTIAASHQPFPPDLLALLARRLGTEQVVGHAMRERAAAEAEIGVLFDARQPVAGCAAGVDDDGDHLSERVREELLQQEPQVVPLILVNGDDQDAIGAQQALGQP
jgi:hypothetical protein